MVLGYGYGAGRLNDDCRIRIDNLFKIQHSMILLFVLPEDYNAGITPDSPDRLSQHRLSVSIFLRT